MQNKVLIKEIFESQQGEGIYIGVNQLFIRFSKCNLNCAYCDTDFKTNLKEFTSDELIKEIEKYDNIHSISLTGAEPLMETDFLLELLPKITKKIYLETNGTLYRELKKIIRYIDIISMDIKLSSSSRCKDMFFEHEAFIDVSVKNQKEIFLKTVFDEKITDDEILKTTKLAEKYNLILVLQPKTDGEILKIKSEFINTTYKKFIKQYGNVRLIPQVHKFLNIR